MTAGPDPKDAAVFRTEDALSAVLAGSSVLAATDLKDPRAVVRTDLKDRKELMDRSGVRDFKDPSANFLAVKSRFRAAIEINLSFFFKVPQPL